MASPPDPRAPLMGLRVRKRRETEDDASGSRLHETKCPVLLSFDEMPESFRHNNNRWILRGYRPISNSFCKSFLSSLYIHNETVNIYSHFIPAVVFLLGEFYILRYLGGRYSRVTSSDLLAFSIFVLTGTICFASSALYHTLMNHSYTVDRLCHRIDMLGIGIFIVGDIVLGVYIVFWCETTLRYIYWSMIASLGALATITNIRSKIQSQKHRRLRTLTFVALGMSVAAPLAHGFSVFGLDLMRKKAFTYTMVAKVGCLLPGTALYATRFPESRWPGRFDMCSSHSFMHILVVLAAIIQITGYLEAFDYAYTHMTCSIP